MDEDQKIYSERDKKRLKRARNAVQIALKEYYQVYDTSLSEGELTTEEAVIWHNICTTLDLLDEL